MIYSSVGRSVGWWCGKKELNFYTPSPPPLTTPLFAMDVCYLPDGPVGELLQLPVQRLLDVALRVQIDRRVELLMHQTTLHGGHLCSAGVVRLDSIYCTLRFRLIIFPLLLQFDCTQIKQVVVERYAKGKVFFFLCLHS